MGVIGEWIRECRLSNGMTQETVAQSLGIRKQSVYKYENGIVTNISVRTIERLSSFFQVRPEYLAGWSDEREKA